MTVKELIKLLSRLDPNKKVYSRVWSPDSHSGVISRSGAKFIPVDWISIIPEGTVDDPKIKKYK